MVKRTRRTLFRIKGIGGYGDVHVFLTTTSILVFVIVAAVVVDSVGWIIRVSTVLLCHAHALYTRDVRAFITTVADTRGG